jgi:protease IV
MRRLLPLLVAATTFAQGQPSQGMRLLAPSVVGDDDPTALETNPAALGFSRSGLVLAVDTLDPDAGGDAIGVFGNLTLGSFSSALSYQSLDHNGKLSVGTALRAGRVAALGLGLHWYDSDQDESVNDEFSADLGLTLRPFPLAALGVVVRNLNTPRFDPTLLERVYDLELGIRPLGTDRIELGGGARIGEDSEDVDPHFRASLSAWGVELRGDVDVDELPGVSGNDVRATAGVAFNLERAGASGGAFIRRPPHEKAAAEGSLVAVRLSQERYRPLPIEPRVFEEITLDGESDERQVVALLAHLHSLLHDDRTAGVLLRIGSLDVGWATVEELRAAVDHLRRAGKPVVAHLEDASLRAYALASAADRVLIGPAGGVRLIGLHASLYFYKGTLDLLGVRADVLKIAEYKSAPEVVTEKKSTGPAREEREAVLDDVYRWLLGSLAASRRSEASAVSARVDQGPYTAGEALRAGLVDEVVAPEELEEWVSRRHPGTVLVPVDDLGPRRPERWASHPRVVVVVVEGDMVEGESRELPLFGERIVGSDTIAQAVESARESDAVAIVVRINSPGGSVGAADRIWREIYKTRGHKPVVASLSDVAASGGYYVASAADRVFADRSTITGSIGIFYGKVDISGLLAKVGVTHETYTRGARADIDSELRPWTDQERAVLMAKLRQFYDRFRWVVSRGRGLGMDEVDRVGRGRVWTGGQARERRLVDALGGFEEALAEAKRRAGLAPDAVVDLAIVPELPQNLARRIAHALLGGERATSELPREVAARLRGLVPPALLVAPGEPLARMDYELRLE